MKPSPARIGLPRWRAPLGEQTRDYIRSIVAGGGEPRFLAPSPEADLRHQLEGLAGLILTGGIDVDPGLYGQRRQPETDRPHPFRDRYELALLEEALRRDIPVLAVCRGHQLFNVCFGGRLIQHIDGDSHRADGATQASAWHEVSLAATSRLGQALGSARVRVNSRHHQGLGPAEMAAGLTAAAVSPDGLIEALESPGHRWAVGVQWHPERREVAAAMKPLFAAFVGAAGEGTQWVAE